MKLLVVIVTYNAMQWAERCFDSMRKSTIKPDVFVVDNGSTDGTQAYIQQNYPEVKFIQSKENLGFGKANNMGMQFALDNDYDYIYLLNQDAWVMPDTFEKLIEVSQKHPEYGILSPFQMNADMKHIDVNFIKSACSWNSNANIFNDLYNQSLDEVYSVSFVMAAHWLITKNCMKKVGGFSPSFPHYGEDVNYKERAKFCGFNVGIVPSLRVVHDRGWRIDPPEKRIYMGYISSIINLSSPKTSCKVAIFRMLNKNIKLVFKYGSAKPISNIFKVLSDIRKINENKKISITKDCAFLNN
jgi:GT2 family glycosyltransferase